MLFDGRLAKTRFHKVKVYLNKVLTSLILIITSQSADNVTDPT